MRANYKVELASGIFLLLGIGALVWLATRATDYGQEIGKETYSISARFINVGDLRDRAPVLTSGVLGDRYIGLEPGGAPEMLQDGDEIFITQSALVLEQVIGKYLFNTGSGDKE